MTTYELDFTYSEPSWGSIEVIADSKEQAEFDAKAAIKELYGEDISDIEITEIKEI